MWRILIGEFLADLKAQKLRTFLTVIAITWGTFAVILLLAFGKGLGDSMMKGMLGAGNQVLIVSGGQTSINHDGLGVGRRIRFTEDDVRMIQETVPHIGFNSPQYGRGGMQLRTELTTTTTFGEGVNPDFEIMRTMYPAAGGRFLNNKDVVEQRRVLFLGDEIAVRLFGDKDPIGGTVMLDGTPFTVVGVMQKKMQTSMNNGPDANRAIIPYTTFKNMYSHRNLGSILIRPSDPIHQQTVINELKRVLSRKYKFAEDDSQAIYIWDFIEEERIGRNIGLGVSIFLFTVGFFTLLIAGVGIANTMYVVVKERTREIGIKKALGARRRHITSQFIFESLFISFLGGFTGIVLAAGVVFGIRALELTEGAGEFLGQPVLSGTIMIITVSVLAIIGFIAGVFPARKAAAVDPIDSLRYE